MQFKFLHNNLNVLDLEKSLAFYAQALDLHEVRRIENPAFTIVYLGDGGLSQHLLELTWLKDRQEPYNLGDNEFHLAFGVEDFAAAHVIPLPRRHLSSLRSILVMHRGYAPRRVTRID